jgi:hypothetical protein
MGENDMDGITPTKQCAVVRIVRELISEPVQNEPPVLLLNRLTTLGNWLHFVVILRDAAGIQRGLIVDADGAGGLGNRESNDGRPAEQNR